jgi:hypothetical protein
MSSAESEPQMSNTESEFTATVARYERCGWSITTIDRAQERAFMRTNALAANGSHESPLTSPERFPACRKLWVDAQGEVQETNVPC